MASVELRTCLMAPADDLADVVAFRVNAWSPSIAADVEIEQFVAGDTVRYRPLKRPGRQRSVRFTIPHLDRTTWHRLSDLTGEVVLFRDTRGLRMFAVFAVLDGDEFRPSNRLQTVSAQLAEVTESEIV